MKILKRLIFPATLILLLLVSFVATALAQSAASGEAAGSLLDLLRPVFDAVTSGEYVYASALALVLAVALVRRFGVKYVPFFGSGVGAAILVLLGSFGAAMATALVGAGLSWAMVKTALGVAIVAAGGYSLVRTLIVEPLLKKYGDKLPKWAAPVIKIVLWVFDNPNRVAKAEAAGDAAVAAKPGKGAAGVIGESDDIA